MKIIKLGYMMDVNTAQVASTITVGKISLYFGYFLISIGLLLSFLKAYLYVIPYNEIQIIKKGNIALSLVLSGILMGYTISLACAIFYNYGLINFILYGLCSAVLQLVIQVIIQKNFEFLQEEIRQNNNVAIGLLLSIFALCIGILSGVSA